MSMGCSPDTESSTGPGSQQNLSLESTAADMNQSQGGSGPVLNGVQPESTAADMNQSQGGSDAVLNGVQPANHLNGLSAMGETADFENIIQQTEPILAFEGGEPFLMKTSPMKPQHVAEVL